MARSHIGRLLEEWIEAEKIRLSLELIEGETKDIEMLCYYQGIVEGMKNVLQHLDTIERD